MRPLAALLLAALALAPASCGGGTGGGVCTPPSTLDPGVSVGPAVVLPTPGGVTIAWTSELAVVGSVEWGTSLPYGAAVADVAPRTAHALRLDGLPPGALVRYRLLHAGTPVGPDRAFRAPPAPGAAVRLAVVGDTGTGCPEALDVRDLVASFDADVVLLAGDVAYTSGTAWQVRDGFVLPFAPLAATRPLFVAWGNHDVATLGGAPLDDVVTMPTNDEDGTERYYSFDWGDVHVVCLDTNAPTDPSSPQRRWLERDLALSTAAWTIVFQHHPAYSSSSHGGDARIVANLVPVFDAFRVDLVLCGHDHNYERTHPMAGGVPTPTPADDAYVDPTGTVYVVTGGGGRELHPSGTSAFTVVSTSVRHACTVDVDGPVLTLYARRTDGSPIDTFTITKTP